MNKIIIYILLAFVQTALFAQTPVPAKAQTQPILLKGGIAHLGNGQVINNAAIGFENGKLTVVSNLSDHSVDETGYEVIDVTGQHIYPGFILPNSKIGLLETNALRATRDATEIGLMKPHVRSLVAYNTDSKIIPTFRFNGVLIAETTPSGGRIAGTSSVMNMEGWNWEDAVLKQDIGIHLNWPSKLSKKFDYSTYTYRTSPNKDYGKEVNELKAFFTTAMSYGQMKDKESNLKLSAMSGLFDGSKRLFLHAGSEKEIIESVSCLKEMGIEHVVLYSGASTWAVKDFLIEKSIPVILKSPHSLPEHEDQSNEIPYQLAVDLTKAGLKVALSHNGMLASGRNLPFYAGTSAAYGLDKEAALQLITLNTATLLGIDQQVGSLEVGKNATLFVSTGDALDMISNDLTSAYIDGKKIVLNSTQQALAEKYKAKYEQE